ncbi:MAG: ATP-binding protein [Syntrophobacteraceae bacterium]|nr:ATP-binding protein [Syntrophobacteraceae bacterium]
MSFPVYPIWISDLAGSALMILFSFLCVRLAGKLRDQDRTNVVWLYLLSVCYVLAAFAVSRSVGHIVKRILITLDYENAWTLVRPYSGAINTVTFIFVASVTLFFGRVWKIYQQILQDKQAIQETHQQLIFMNRNLENLVAERTRELALSERKYRRIFEVSRDMLAVVRDDGTLMTLNPSGIEMLGLSSDDISSGRRLFQDFFETTDDWNFLKQTLEQMGYVADTEISMKRADNSCFSGLISGGVQDQPGENPGSHHFLVKDISYRKAMEQQILQADKLASIGQLAAGIAHEINNPLGIILGYTQLLIRSEKENSQNSEDLRIIEKHTRSCKTIVENLLSFSRRSQTKKAVSRINDVMDEVISVVRHHFELEKIGIEKEFDPRIPVIAVDEAKMKQVFMNLIMNARQAMKCGTVRIETRYDEPGHKAVVRVRDEGTGIEPRHMTRIFDPFFTTKPTGEGTGLGLSVSYGIVKDHGGEILVESEVGKGATFTVTLPVLEQTISVPAEDGAQRKSQSGS